MPVSPVSSLFLNQDRPAANASQLPQFFFSFTGGTPTARLKLVSTNVLDHSGPDILRLSSR